MCDRPLGITCSSSMFYTYDFLELEVSALCSCLGAGTGKALSLFGPVGTVDDTRYFVIAY